METERVSTGPKSPPFGSVGGGGSDAVPAHSYEAEAAILGAMIYDQAALREGLAELRPEHFYVLVHQKIYAGIVESFRRHGKADPILVKDSLADMGVLDECGGPAKIMQLIEEFPTSSNSAEYCRVVREQAAMRTIANHAREAIHAIQMGLGVDGARDAIHRAAKAAAMTGRRGKTARELCDDALARFHHQVEHGVDLTWGLPPLDNAMGGMRRGETTIIGARTSQGKTSTTLNVVLANVRNKKRILYVAYENIEQVVPRLAALDSGVPLRSFLCPERQSAMERAQVEAAIRKIGDAYGEYLTVLGPTPAAKVRAILELEKYDIVVADYIQRYAVAHKERDEDDRRHVTVSRAFAEWYDISMSYPVHVLVLSQVSRREDKSKHREPVLEELKESGDLECFADTVLLLYWRWRQTLDDKDDKRIYTIVIAKTKMGEPKKITLGIDPSTLRLGGV